LHEILKAAGNDSSSTFGVGTGEKEENQALKPTER
jgi:hypothetical protein